jgi:hypothetical protein
VLPSPILRGLAAAFGFILLSSPTTTAHAQNPSGQVPTDMVEQQMKAVTPMVTEMTRTTLRTSLEFYAQPSTAKALATFTKNYLDALVTVGFSRDEAIRIVAAHGLPTLPGVGR